MYKKINTVPFVNENIIEKRVILFHEAQNDINFYIYIVLMYKCV